MTKLIVALRNFAKAPKNAVSALHKTHCICIIKTNLLTLVEELFGVGTSYRKKEILVWARRSLLALPFVF